jgi:hypothetical protein
LENPNNHKNKGKRHWWEFLMAFVFHHRTREYLEVTFIKKEWGFWCFCKLLIKFCRLELLLVPSCWDDQTWEVNVYLWSHLNSSKQWYSNQYKGIHSWNSTTQPTMHYITNEERTWLRLWYRTLALTLFEWQFVNVTWVSW